LSGLQVSSMILVQSLLPTHSPTST
jgi:hypothetical protein